MDDTMLAEAFAKVPADIRKDIRDEWLRFVEGPGDPAGANLFRALVMLGMGEDVVTRFLLHAGEAELALIASYGLEKHPQLVGSANLPAGEEMLEFWLVLGAMAAGHLAARMEE